jgi:hypothetical protein
MAIPPTGQTPDLGEPWQQIETDVMGLGPLPAVWPAHPTGASYAFIWLPATGRSAGKATRPAH